MFQRLNVLWRLQYRLIRFSDHRQAVSQRLQRRSCNPVLTIAGLEGGLGCGAKRMR